MLPRHAEFRLGLVLIIALGCAEQQRGGPRVPTEVVTGIVTVDGKPASNLAVKCHPVGEAKVPQSISAFTDDKGQFKLSTYEGGDGVPEGEYKLTFQWGQLGLMSGQYSGDKLNKRYSDPKTSEFSVNVTKGKPVDLGSIELKSSDGGK